MATTAFNFTKLLEEIDLQKRNYHEKTLTADAEWSNYLRYLQTYDIFVNWASFLIPQFVFNATSLIAILGIDPIELDIFKLAFDISMPSIDEFLKGINVKIDLTPIDIALELYNIPSTATDFVTQFVATKGPAGEKCVYGKSAYGRCYVDPDAVREFINNAILAMFKKHKDAGSFRNEVEAMAKALGVSHMLVENIFNRIMLINSYYRAGFILNISQLDRAVLASSDDKIPVYTFDGTVAEVGVQYLTDALIGCVLDLTPLDYCFVVPPRSALKGDLDVPQYTPPLIDSVHRIVKSNISRYMYTPMALANYATGKERVDYKLSQRVELWGQLMAMRYAVDALVESYIQSLLPDADKITINMYATAVRQLFGHIYKRHGWGMKLWSMLNDDELKVYWVEYWSRQGLDYNVLSALYDYIIDIVLHMAKRKYEIASSFKRSRLLHTLH
jgi:hypothetical protein